MEFERRERYARHIDLTALVDIVFHLMVFFMLTTTFVVSESMELSLPSAGATQATPTQATRIMVMPGGALTVDNVPISQPALQNVLVERLGANVDTRIVILTTPGVSVQELVGVLDMVYLAGGRNVQVDKGVV